MMDARKLLRKSSDDHLPTPPKSDLDVHCFGKDPQFRALVIIRAVNKDMGQGAGARAAQGLEPGDLARGPSQGSRAHTDHGGLCVFPQPVSEGD